MLPFKTGLHSRLIAIKSQKGPVSFDSECGYHWNELDRGEREFFPMQRCYSVTVIYYRLAIYPSNWCFFSLCSDSNPRYFMSVTLCQPATQPASIVSKTRARMPCAAVQNRRILPSSVIILTNITAQGSYLSGFYQLIQSEKAMRLKEFETRQFKSTKSWFCWTCQWKIRTVESELLGNRLQSIEPKWL